MLCGLGFTCALVVSFLDKMGVRALGDEDNLKMQSKKLVGIQVSANILYLDYHCMSYK